MMIDLVFDYMAAKGVVFYSQEEMKTAEAGIREYLQCNGIPCLLYTSPSPRD